MKQIEITQQIIDFFKSNDETQILAGYIKNVSDVLLYNEGNSYALVVYASTDQPNVCLFTDSTLFIDEVCKVVKGDVSFCGVNSFVKDYLASKYCFEWLSNCGLFVWNGEPLTYECKGDLRTMDATYSQQISDGTPYHADLGEIHEAIEKRVSSALYIDGKPVCWCVLHTENSLGMLYTLPEHRHKGYALEVMTDICRKVIDCGDIPFCYIIQGNVASENLAPKYNLRYVEPSFYVGVKL